MKKQFYVRTFATIFGMITVILLFTLSGCSEANPDINIQDNGGEVTTPSDSKKNDLENTVPEIESKPNSDESDSIAPEIVPERNSAEMIYRSLEEVMGAVTDVMIGEYIGKTDFNGYYYFEFSISRQLRGIKTEGNVTVEMLPADYIVNGEGSNKSFSTYESNYKKGEKYLLLLKRFGSVYDEGDRFSFVSDSLVIPVDGTKGETAKMYGTQLSGHITTAALRDALTNGTLSECVTELVKDNPLSTADEYIRSTDITEIIAGSDYVLKVTPVEERNIVENPINRTVYMCTVDEVLKGEISQKTVYVIFPKDTVIVGEAYIVAAFEVADTAKTYFKMSSKSSVYASARRDEIVSLIG